MKKHRNNLMRRGLAAVLSGMMLLATVMPAMAEEINLTPVETESATMNASTAPAAVPTPSAGTSMTSELVSAGTPVAEEIVSGSASNGSVSNGNPEAPEVPQENGEGTPEPVSNGSQPEAVSGSTNSSEGSTDSSAPVPADADGTTPESTIELLPEDGSAPEHTLIEINEDETTTKELSTEPMTLEAHTYNGINVIVDADAGVLPADAHLSVFEVKSEAHREETAEKLDEAAVDYDDYMVLDISLYDSNFNKIEPESGVRVSITMDAEKLPEEAVAETLGVQHLEEDENGEVKDVVQVADNGLETEGLVEVTENNEVAADFEVGSFSKFVLTWKKHTGFRIEFEVYKAIRDENTKTVTPTEEVIADFRWPDSMGIAEGVNQISLTDLNAGDVDIEGKVFVLEDLLRQFSLYRWDEYLFVPELTTIGRVTEVDRFVVDVDPTDQVKRFKQHGVLNGVPDSWGIGYKMNETVPVKIYYEVVEPGLNTVATVDSTAKGIKMHMFRFDSSRNGLPWNEPYIGGRINNALFYKAEDATDGLAGGNLSAKTNDGKINGKFVANGVISPIQYGSYVNHPDINKRYYYIQNSPDTSQDANYKDAAPNYERLKFGRAQIWPSLTSIRTQGDGFPLIDTGRTDKNGNLYEYTDYAREYKVGNMYTTKVRQESPLVEGVNATSLREWYRTDGVLGAHQKESTDPDVNYVQQVNHLFREDIYNNSGYFYYGSDINAAVLDGKGAQADFKVYEQTASPAQNSKETNIFWAARGNFLPYNEIDGNNQTTTTQTDMAGNKIDPSSEAYGKGVYAVIPVENDDQTGQSPYGAGSYGGVDKGIVYNYGLSMEARFEQPVNGQVYRPTDTDKKNPEDMIFEFNGDDDVWVYIDGVLVIDLGGTHAAQNAIINFATGDIYYTNNGSYRVAGNNPNLFGHNGAVIPNESVYQGVENNEYYKTYTGEMAPLNYDVHTTIRQMFRNAGAEGEAEWELGTETFADASRHTLQFFYMEHGGGAANLRLSFNLQVVPAGSTRIEKEFSEDEITYTENGEVVLPDGFEAVFNVYQAKNAGTEDAPSFVPDKLLEEVTLSQETVNDGSWRLVPVKVLNQNGVEEERLRFVYTVNDLSVKDYYIIDERIKTPGTGYISTDVDVSATREYVAEKNTANQFLAGAAGPKAGSDTEQGNTIATVNWGNGGVNAQYVFKAYTTEGDAIKNVAFANPTDVIASFDGLLPAGQNSAKTGDNILFENVLKSNKAGGADNKLFEIKDEEGFTEYVLDHFEWAETGDTGAVGVRITDSGYALLARDNGFAPVLAGGEYAKGSGSREVKVVYKRYRVRTDAFRVFSEGEAGYPARVVFDNKYLTPLKIRKKLTSRMEADLNRDFTFRLYVKGDMNTPLTQGTVYGLEKETWAYTGEKLNVPVMPQTDGKGTYYQFTIRRDQEIQFLLPKNRNLQYQVVEIIEPGYQVTAQIEKATTGEGVLALTSESYEQNEAQKTNWVSAEELFTEMTTITYKNGFDIARTGLSMSTVPFILMVVFALLAIGGLAFITIRRRAMNIDD